VRTRARGCQRGAAGPGLGGNRLAGHGSVDSVPRRPHHGALGVLIAIRRPRNAIGWFLLVIAAAGAVYLFTDFLAIRGLLSGAVPDGWVAWPGNVFAAASLVGELLIFFLILFFPGGRLLPGPRWRWVAGVIAAIAILAFLTLAANAEDADEYGFTIPPYNYEDEFLDCAFPDDGSGRRYHPGYGDDRRTCRGREGSGVTQGRKQ